MANCGIAIITSTTKLEMLIVVKEQRERLLGYI